MDTSVVRSRWSFRVSFTAGLLAAVSGLYGCNPQPPPFRGTSVDNVVWGRDFTLTAHTGERFDSQSLRGKVQVVFFGYTHCPDICAPTLAKLAQARQQLGDDAVKLQVLFVTVDPTHDTPAQLTKFLAGFDPTFIGLTGTQQEIRQVAGNHMSYFKAEGKNSQQVTHTGTMYLKDRQGRMRVLVKESVSVEDLVHDLRLLIKS
jgi:protein SCO1/2